MLNIAVKTLVLQDSSVISITSESASNPRELASHWRLAIPISFLISRVRISWPKTEDFLRSFSPCDRNFQSSVFVVRKLWVQVLVRKQTILTVFSWMFHYLQATDVISGKLRNYFTFHIPPNSLFTSYNIRHHFRAHVFGICG